MGLDPGEDGVARDHEVDDPALRPQLAALLQQPLGFVELAALVVQLAQQGACQLRGVRAAARRLPGQDDRAVQVLLGRLDVGQPAPVDEERAGLVEVEPQGVGVDLGELAAHPQPRQRQLRPGAAGRINDRLGGAKSSRCTTARCTCGSSMRCQSSNVSTNRPPCRVISSSSTESV
jgi:hypothetical protein